MLENINERTDFQWTRWTFLPQCASFFCHTFATFIYNQINRQCYFFVLLLDCVLRWEMFVNGIRGLFWKQGKLSLLNL